MAFPLIVQATAKAVGFIGVGATAGAIATSAQKKTPKVKNKTRRKPTKGFKRK